MHNQNVTNLESMVSTSRPTPTAGNPIPVTLFCPLSNAKLTLRAGTCIVGSSPDANYVVAEKTVSRQHVSLQLVPEGVRVVDLQSTNGTAYCGHCVTDLVLTTNGKLRLGRATLEVNFEWLAPTEEDLPTCRKPHLDQVPGMPQLYVQLERLRGSLVGVLLTGDSVMGKRFVARTIHEHSIVNNGALVTVSCGVSGRESVRSELFGASTGSSLSTSEGRTSAFVRAEGGTLFLDEIDELPLDVQAMMVRLLQERERVPPHRDHAGWSRVRLIAASERDLEGLVRDGLFRQDLYHRLVARVHVPAGHERREDATPPLAAGVPANAGPRARIGYGRA